MGAINYCLQRGYQDIYIMGHSLGSTKTIYAYNKLLEENKKDILKHIKAIILLSLVDIPMAIKVYLKDNFRRWITFAKNMKKEGMENELMPENSFIYPISVKTFLRYAIDNNDIDFARFSDKNYDFDKLNNIDIPLFMRWGNKNELIIQDANELCENLKQKIHNNKLDINFIDGANHSYEGKEDLLSKEIKNFLVETNRKK